MHRLSDDPLALQAGASDVSVPNADPSRAWSRAECEALFKKIVSLTDGTGDTYVTIRLSWAGHLRWAQNSPTTAGEVRKPRIIIRRIIRGNFSLAETNNIDDASLKRAIVKAEQHVKGVPDSDPPYPLATPVSAPYLNPPLWSDTTYNMTYQGRSDAARTVADPALEAKLVSAGYIETRAVTWAVFSTKGIAVHASGTMATCTESVRNMDGSGSGWAGVMQTDWTKLNIAQISARALQKCVASANPRAIEPGRYTTILEPQAVGHFMIFAVSAMDRVRAEEGITDGKPSHPYNGGKWGTTKIGQRVLDERLTITTDPADPDAPYMPFNGEGFPYRPVTWVEKGVLKALAYDEIYARKKLGVDTPLLNPTAFRVSGGDTSIEEMIATTERGVLVTRFGSANLEDFNSLHLSTVTADGLWLIEHGKIKFPVKNMRVLESPLFIGNSVLQLGKPERIYGAHWTDSNDLDLSNFPPMAFGNIPMVVPPMKVRDFNFISLSDAV